MHIAFLTFEYVTETNFDGGLANYLHRVSLGLTKRGHQVEIFTLSSVDETIDHNGILVHRIKLPNRTINWISRVIRGYYSREAISILPCAWKIRQRVLGRHRAVPFDIVQTVNLLSLGLGLLHFSSIPVVVRASSYQPLWRQYDRLSPYRFSRSTQLIDSFERYMVRRATAVYAPSDLIANAFRQYVRANVDVIRTPFVLDNVVLDPSIYEEHLVNFKYLLFFGTVKVLKGGLVLGKALKVALSKFPDMHMVIVGKNMPIKDDWIEPKRTVLQYIFEQVSDQRNRIHHFKRLRHEQLYPIIQGATGIVLPSRIDNFPNACLEAMAFGKVIIGTKGASFEEILQDGISGILVQKDDPVALAEAMGRVWKMSEKEREEIGKAAKSSLKELEPNNTCHVLEKYFQTWIDARQAPPSHSHSAY